jgi:hypothetical protein
LKEWRLCLINGKQITLQGIKTYAEICELAGQPIGATCTYVFAGGLGSGELTQGEALAILHPCSITCVMTGAA